MLVQALIVCLSTTMSLQQQASSNESTLQLQHDYLVAKWCVPFQSLTPSGYPSYDAAVSSFFVNQCGAYVTTVQTIVTFFGLDNVWMPMAVSTIMSGASAAVIQQQNYTVSASFLRMHCQNRFTVRFYWAVWELLAAFITPTVIGGAIFYLQGFVGMLFSPVVLVSITCSALVLREVGRGQEVHIMPLLQAELALQLLGYIVFAFFLMFSSWLPAAPFCFLSPLAALNFEAVGYAFEYWAINPIWLLSSLVKSLIMIDRIFAVYRPVLYQQTISKRLVKKILIYVVVVTTLCVGAVTAIFFVKLFAGQTIFTNANYNAGVGVQVSVFYTSLLCLSAFFQAVCATILAIRLWNGFHQVGPASLSLAEAQTAQQEKRVRTITVMVISTTGLNMLSCCAQVVYIIAYECAVGCAAIIPTGIRTDIIILVTGIVCDLNSSASFLVQCVLSKPYRRAARKLLVTPIARRFRLWMSTSQPSTHEVTLQPVRPELQQQAMTMMPQPYEEEREEETPN